MPYAKEGQQIVSYQHIGVNYLHIHKTYSRVKYIPVIPRINMLSFVHLHAVHQIRLWKAMTLEINLRKLLPNSECKNPELAELDDICAYGGKDGMLSSHSLALEGGGILQLRALALLLNGGALILDSNPQ